MSIPAHTLKKTFSFFFSSLQVKSAVDKHTLDPGHLLRVVCGRALCSAADHFLSYTRNALSSALNRCCRQYYSTHIFHAMARLDVPTWDDPAVASQINALSPRRPSRTISWAVIVTFVETVSVVLRMLSQTVVLFGVLRGHKEGFLFALLTLASHFVSYLNLSFTYGLSRSRKAFTFFTFADWLTDLISLGRHHAQ